MNVLDLFSGIGGFSLGLERAGMQTVAFCEIEPFCRKVLTKHWPNVKQYTDVRTLTAEQLRSDGIAVDVICGGFPCQDISVAGKGAGLAGERSGLWREYARIIGEVRPRYVIVENVAALLGRGLGDVLGDLAALGYDAEWHCIPASYVGALHRRDRVWVIAYPQELQCDVCADYSEVCMERGQIPEFGNCCGASDVAYTNGTQCEGIQLSERIKTEYANFGSRGWWSVEPDVGQVVDGVPPNVDRLKGLGNAVVPQIPELIGRAILNAERKAA